MRKLLTTCPSCQGSLVITELSCTVCDTVIRGTYTASRFEQLSEENLRFLELFVISRGNVKEMERETGLGYWTIRSRLDAIIEQMQAHQADSPGTAAAAPPGQARLHRRGILEAVERGELSVAEAEQRLRRLP